MRHRNDNYQQIPKNLQILKLHEIRNYIESQVESAITNQERSRPTKIGQLI